MHMPIQVLVHCCSAATEEEFDTRFAPNVFQQLLYVSHTSEALAHLFQVSSFIHVKRFSFFFLVSVNNRVKMSFYQTVLDFINDKNNTTMRQSFIPALTKF